MVVELLKPIKVVELINEAAERKAGWSLIRLGDGESGLLGYPRFTHPVRLERWLRVFFGPYVKDLSTFLPIAQHLEAAILASDVIGTMGRQTDDIEPLCQYLLDENNISQPNPTANQYERDLLNFLLRNLGVLVGAGKHFCSSNVMITIARQNLFTRFLSGRKHIGLVSCHDLRPFLRDTFAIPNIDFFPVPGEAKFHKGPALACHFPERFLELEKEIPLRIENIIYLVGAGPCGKIYCKWIRDSGGIAVDVGSILDLWAGQLTRSYMNDIGVSAGAKI